MMKKLFLPLLLLGAVLLMPACEENEDNLRPAEERIAEAKAALMSELTAPANGWRLQYQPEPGSGIFNMILNFDEDGMVHIQSDVADNNGEFFEHTIPYRIDNGLGLELILETYGVFHYLFEQDRATFGAEFEFLYKKKEGLSLVFESLSDGASPTQLTFVPANPGDESLFSRDIAQNLDAFAMLTPQMLQPESPIQQIILEDRNISVFWSFDPAKRVIAVDLAAVGKSLEEIVDNSNAIGIFHESGYAIQDGKMVLTNPLTFSLGGQQVTLGEIRLETFDMNGPGLCSTGSGGGPQYKGSSPGNGAITMVNSYINSAGADFQPNIYSINAVFMFDGAGNSLAENNGIIEANFPGALGFYFIYDVTLNNPDIPSTSMGLVLADGSLFLKEFEVKQQVLNMLQLEFKENYYHSEGPGVGDEAKLTQVLEEIFAGNEVYAFNFPQQNAVIFRLFNPCNAYEVFLVL